MKRILINFFFIIYILFLSCKLDIKKEIKLEKYQLSDVNNKWVLDSIGYYIDVKKFIDSDNDGIGDFKGIINNIEYFSAYPDSLNIDFIILGDIFTKDNTINKKIGDEKDIANLVKIADTKRVKVLIEIILDFEKNNNYTNLERFLSMGIAGFRIICKNLTYNDNMNNFINFVKNSKNNYKYLFVFCTLINKKNSNLFENSTIDAIEYLTDDITDIDFNNNFFNIINFNLKDSNYLNIFPKLIFMLPKIPVIKYGYEFGILDPENFIMSQNIKNFDKNETFREYKKTIKLRKELNITPDSTFIFHSNDKNIISFFLLNKDKKYFIVINKNPFLSLCYLKEGEWQKRINFKKDIVLREIYGDSINTKYYIPENKLDVFANIRDSSLKIFEILE